MTDLVVAFLNAQVDVGFGHPILLREIVGNVFGLASAVLAMQRRVVAWPIGIVGNVLLFTVFLGGAFGTPQQLDLWGQAGRQVFFFAVSVYGWVRWASYSRHHPGVGVGVAPKWAPPAGRLQLIIGGLVGWVGFYFALTALNSWNALADAWILTGSILATYGMARGWTEFWLIWVAVDIVGIPLLLAGGFYPSAIMYAVYAGFVILGFITWRRQMRAAAEPAPVGALK